LPAFRHIEQSSDARLHHDTIARPPAPPVPPEDETDNKSEPQIPESGQSVVGLSGVGKTWLACALAQAACRDGITVLYKRMPRLFDELEIAHGDGRFPRLFRSLTKTDLLILDDWGPDRLNAAQRRDLMEIVEDRYEAGSTLITSQLPIDAWHDVIGEPTFADAILDRLVHNAYRIGLDGQSMRKTKLKTGDESTQN
jgi:DNA replication protein DnaC